MYGHARYLREGQESDETFVHVHARHVESSLEEEWRQRNLKELVDLRAMNANIQLRSAEKARKGRASGPINCSPENVMIKHDPESVTIKHDHNYGNSSDFPDIGPDPLNTTDYRGSDRNQPFEYADMSRSYAQSAPQYYYTKEPIQERASYTRVKLEPPRDPA